MFLLNNGVQGVTGSPFSDGSVYYFQIRANNSAGHGPWTVYGGASPTGVTVGPPSPTGISVSTTITVPSGVTIAPGAPLYIGYLGQNSFYSTEVASPQVGDNIATIRVPQGSWLLLGFVDQNNDGEIESGDLTNSRQNGPPGVTVGSGTTALGETIPATNMIPLLQTVYSQNTYNGGSSSGYNLSLSAGEGAKQPVAAVLTTASNPDVPVPMDISSYCEDCRNVEFQNDMSLGSFAPSVGDNYALMVTYSDGSQDTVTATVTGWNGGSTVVGASNLPTNLSPSGTNNSSTTPTFTWTNPGGLTSSDSDSFSICCNNNQTVWQIPDESSVSLSNGFSSSISSITWGADLTGDSSNTPNPSSLSPGTVYH